QGYIFAVVMLPDAASLARTEKVVDQFDAALMGDPSVLQVVAVSGLDPLTFSFKTSAAAIWLPMTSWDVRKGRERSPAALVGKTFAVASGIKDAVVIAFEPPPIEGLSAVGGFEAYIQSRGNGDIKALETMTQKFI